MTRRSLVLGVLAWVAVVISASAVTWAVIDAAGQQVLSASDVPPQVAASPVPGPSTGATRSSPSRPSPTRSRSATRAPTSSAPSPSAVPTQAVPSPAPTPSSARPSPAGQPSPSGQPAPPASQQRAWAGPSGSVSVRCSGRTASLQSASPNDGYRVEVGSRGPGEVEVTFKGDEREIKVRATCVSGAPRFSTEGRSGSKHSDD